MRKINTGETKGIARKFDSLGRIVIPKEFRKELNIGDKDKMEIYLLKDGLYIKKVGM